MSPSDRLDAWLTDCGVRRDQVVELLPTHVFTGTHWVPNPARVSAPYSLQFVVLPPATAPADDPRRVPNPDWVDAPLGIEWPDPQELHSGPPPEVVL